MTAFLELFYNFFRMLFSVDFFTDIYVIAFVGLTFIYLILSFFRRTS